MRRQPSEPQRDFASVVPFGGGEYVALRNPFGDDSIQILRCAHFFVSLRTNICLLVGCMPIDIPAMIGCISDILSITTFLISRVTMKQLIIIGAWGFAQG